MMKGGVPKKEDDNEMKMGIECETEEHGAWADAATIRRIVKDHLRENPKYYTEEEEAEGEDKTESKDEKEQEGEENETN